MALTEAQVVIFTVPTTCSKLSIEMVDFIIIIFTVRLLVVGPVLKWLALCISPCSLSWPHLWIFLAQISYVGLLGLSNVHLRILFLI